ncbi:MAG: Cna B-type domain-containing protein [Pseudoramibacter sp.]
MKSKRSIQTKWLIAIVTALMAVMMISLFCLIQVHAEPNSQTNQDLTNAVTVSGKKSGDSDYTVTFTISADHPKAGDYFKITLPDGLQVQNQDSLALTVSSDDKTQTGTASIQGSAVTVTLSDYAGSHYDLSGTLVFKNAQGGGTPSAEGRLSGKAYGTLTIQDSAADDSKLPVAGAELVLKNKDDGQTAATLKTDRNGKAEIDQLPEGSYTLETQTAADGYEKSDTEDVTIKSGETQQTTITSEPVKTAINVKRIWDDSDNQDGIRPKTIQLSLVIEGSQDQVIDTKKISAGEGWTTAFRVRKYDQNGQKIRYSVVEQNVSQYDLSVMGGADAGFLLVHRHTPAVVDVPVQVSWTDHKNRYDDRPSAVIVSLLKDGKPVNSQVVVSDASGRWRTLFQSVPEFENGKKIHYTVTEDKIDGYKTRIDGTKITNRLKSETDDEMMAAEAKRQQQNIVFLKGFVRHPIQTVWSWLKNLF